MAQGRGDLGERDENEAAVGEAGMRDFEVACADDGGGVKEDVDVEGAWAEADQAATPELEFDGADGVEELEREKRSFGFDAAVEEPGLLGEADGFSGVERRAKGDADANGIEEVEGAGDAGGAVAEVGAEGEIDGLGLRHGRRV